jgi:hypothetical protein
MNLTAIMILSALWSGHTKICQHTHGGSICTNVNIFMVYPAPRGR